MHRILHYNKPKSTKAIQIYVYHRQQKLNRVCESRKMAAEDTAGSHNVIYDTTKLLPSKHNRMILYNKDAFDRFEDMNIYTM